MNPAPIRAGPALRPLAAALALCALQAAATEPPSPGAGPDATPAVLYPQAGAWRQWGSGELRWFGLRLYRATLWVAGGGAAAPDSVPHALMLDYQRDIPRSRLVGVSLDEMRRMGGDTASLQRWKVDLERVFPDVRDGERIVGLHLPGQGARFFHQGRPTGDVMDAEFARRFFAIWLAPETRSPEVRAALLTRPAAGE